MAASQVLDAPGLQDDFYLNLMEWSCQNVLAVGLGSVIYLRCARTAKVRTHPAVPCALHALTGHSQCKAVSMQRVSRTYGAWTCFGLGSLGVCTGVVPDMALLHAGHPAV